MESGELDLPYRLRDDFLSAAEFSFYRVLNGCLRDRAPVFTKVNLADIFFVAKPNENQSYRNKIDRKHVDFLVCDPTTMKPIFGIELDDSSDARPDRQLRDDFVDQVFKVASLPLVRVPAKAGYSPKAIAALIEPYLIGVPAMVEMTLESMVKAVPNCPKCGVPMVEQTVPKGKNAGHMFFGCTNYPKCQRMISP